MRSKQIIKAIVKYIIMSVLLLSFTEGTIRLFHQGFGYNLFTETFGNPDLLELNQDFALKNCTKKIERSVQIKKIKNENTFRIFVLGKSEHKNLPENPNASFSHILKYSLQRSFPEKDIELINLAFDRENSYLQYDIARQLKKYDPDVVVISPGNNEFYGHRTNPIRSSLQSLFVFQAIEGIFKSTSPQVYQEISPNSKVFWKSAANFERNLNKTVTTLQNNGISVVLINSASNIKDMPPQKSYFSRSDSSHLKILFDKGKKAYYLNDIDLAYSFFSKIYQKDKAHAETCYYLGKIALLDNDIQKAKELLEKAVEFDRVKSRTPAEINRIISKIAVVNGCPLVDIASSFSRHSAQGIPGDNLFCGSQQANLAGNILIASECYKILLNEDVISKIKVADYGHFGNLPLTPFDSIYDQICKTEHKEKTILFLDSQTISSSFEKKTTTLFADKSADWEDSMNALYQYYIDNKNYKLAFKIIENLALENPYNIDVNNRASKVASLLGDSQRVIHYAKKAYAIKPNIEVAQLLLINYLKLDMPEDALSCMIFVRKTKLNNDLSNIFSATCEIIDLKKLLEKNPHNSIIIKQIAEQYKAIGNDDIAAIYDKMSKASFR